MAERIILVHPEDYKYICYQLNISTAAEFVRINSFLFKPDVISEYERMSLVGDRAREMKMTTHEKKKMTRKEAIEIFKKHMPDVVKAEKTIDFYIEAGMLEIVEEEIKGLPIGFSFPFSKREEWTDFVDSLNKQGFIIKKA